MTWIETIPYDRATGKLRSLYDRVKGPNDNVDNIMLAHGLRPHTMEGHMALSQGDIQAMLDTGWDDGEILEINQVTAYFNYANRTVLGLGINTEGDVIGLSPGDGDVLENWNHA